MRRDPRRARAARQRIYRSWRRKLCQNHGISRRPRDVDKAGAGPYLSAWSPKPQGLRPVTAWGSPGRALNRRLVIADLMAVMVRPASPASRPRTFRGGIHELILADRGPRRRAGRQTGRL